MDTSTETNMSWCTLYLSQLTPYLKHESNFKTVTSNLTKLKKQPTWALGQSSLTHKAFSPIAVIMIAQKPDRSPSRPLHLQMSMTWLMMPWPFEASTRMAARNPNIAHLRVQPECNIVRHWEWNAPITCQAWKGMAARARKQIHAKHVCHVIWRMNALKEVYLNMWIDTAVYLWMCTYECVPMNVYLWMCAYECEPMNVYLWMCAYECVPMNVYLW
jgi:hypothetical protein